METEQTWLVKCDGCQKEWEVDLVDDQAIYDGKECNCEASYTKLERLY